MSIRAARLIGGALAVGLALGVGGCFLETEQCGPDFRPVDGRCVPVKRADAATRADAAPDTGVGEDALIGEEGDDTP